MKQRVKYFHPNHYGVFTVLAAIVGYLFFLRATDTGSIWQWGIVLVSPFLVGTWLFKAVKNASK